MAIRVVAVVMVCGGLRGAEPGRDIGDLAVGAERAGIEDCSRVERALVGDEDGRAGVQRAQAAPERGVLGEVGLAEYDAVRNSDLLHRLRLLLELRRAVHRIDHRDDAVEPIAGCQQRLAHQGLDDGRRVGEAGGLDQHARGSARQQVAQRAHEIAADGAARGNPR